MQTSLYQFVRSNIDQLPDERGIFEILLDSKVIFIGQAPESLRASVSEMANVLKAEGLEPQLFRWDFSRRPWLALDDELRRYRAEHRGELPLKNEQERLLAVADARRAAKVRKPAPVALGARQKTASAPGSPKRSSSSGSSSARTSSGSKGSSSSRSSSRSTSSSSSRSSGSSRSGASRMGSGSSRSGESRTSSSSSRSSSGSSRSSSSSSRSGGSRSRSETPSPAPRSSRAGTGSTSPSTSAEASSKNAAPREDERR